MGAWAAIAELHFVVRAIVVFKQGGFGNKIIADGVDFCQKIDFEQVGFSNGKAIGDGNVAGRVVEAGGIRAINGLVVLLQGE